MQGEGDIDLSNSDIDPNFSKTTDSQDIGSKITKKFSIHKENSDIEKNMKKYFYA